METIRWGIMGAGGIAHRFAASLAQVPGARLEAIAGRRAEKLDAFAARYPVAPERRYAGTPEDETAGYARLVEDPGIDAVYLALPHALHASWAIRLLKAGKAVLCEKPAVLTADEARAVAAVARDTGTLFMEAMKSRFVPAHDRARALLAEGSLGPIRRLEVVHRLDYGDVRGGYLLDPTQGGTLYDLGCYGVSWIDELLAGPLAVERAAVRWRAVGPSGDGGASARVDWEDDVRLQVGGVPVHLDLSGGADRYEVRCTAVCREGSLTVPLLHRPASVIVERPGAPSETIEAPYDVDDFHGEIAHMGELLRAGATESPVMPLAATVRVAEIIDAIRAAYPVA